MRQVVARLEGAAADQAEEAQSRYQDAPGFLAVVNDSNGAIVVVDAPALSTWQQRLAGTGVRVAPSCVNSALLDRVKAAVGLIKPKAGGVVTAGYDALVDAIVVSGTSETQFAEALAAVAPDASEAAVAAISGGTLRFAP